jgi:transcriptional regulator GlxA family with amidase domain
METQQHIAPSDLDRVRAEVREALATGAIVDLPRVACRIGRSPRTLQRVIASSGTSFRALVQDVRREMAFDLLARGELSIERVSWAVGYADPKALRRAFHRWGELSPSHVRRQLARPEHIAPPSPDAASL